MSGECRVSFGKLRQMTDSSTCGELAGNLRYQQGVFGAKKAGHPLLGGIGGGFHLGNSPSASIGRPSQTLKVFAPARSD